jgi:2-polyprenyl-3-methyl-5-hydroxy-6-metoxy-1,4-benzoquinol methylase
MNGISYMYYSAKAETSHGYLYPVVNNLLRGLPPGSSVLDLGCGNGSFVSLFRGRSWKLHGTDFSPSGIEFAQRNFPDIDFFLADASANSAVTSIGQVDAIISTEVVEHLYDPKSFIRNAYEALKPGAFFVITTPYHGYLKNLMLAVTGKLDEHFTVLWDHGHIKFWSRKTLQAALTEAGFVDIEFKGAGRFPLLWKSMVIRARRPLICFPQVEASES